MNVLPMLENGVGRRARKEDGLETMLDLPPRAEMSIKQKARAVIRSMIVNRTDRPILPEKFPFLIPHSIVDYICDISKD